MRSDALSVDEYLQDVPEARRAALQAVRKRCRKILVGFDEGMAYGMPSYTRDGVVEVAFASQKNYISLYVLRSDVLNEHRHEFESANLGKGCVRYRSPDQIDMDLVDAILEDTAASRGPVC